MTSDPRVVAGLSAQRELLNAKIAAGERQRGWKLGFGSPSGLELLSLKNPLIGFMLESGELPNGASVDISGWTGPAIEAEIAVRLKHSIPASAEPTEIMNAVDAFLPALEIVDLDHPPADPERILSGNIFHRNYVLGPDLTRGWGAGPHALTGHVRHNNEWTEPVLEVQALTGDYLANLTELIRSAPQVGNGTRSGDIILLGSIVPPVRINTGDAFEFQANQAPSLEVNFISQT